MTIYSQSGRGIMLHFFRLFLASLLGLLLVSCTRSITVSGYMPSPLVAKLPVSIGLIFEQGFNTYIYSQVDDGPSDSGAWEVSLGEAQYELFATVTESMFQRVERVDTFDCRFENFDEGQASFRPDGCLRIKLVEYAIGPPSFVGGDSYAVSLTYEIGLLDTNGNLIDTWPEVVGYSKSEGNLFNAEDTINKLTVEALRDVGGHLTLDWRNRDGVSAWLDASARRSEPKPIM